MPCWLCRRACGSAQSQRDRIAVLSWQDRRRQVCHGHSMARWQWPVRWALDVVLGLRIAAARARRFVVGFAIQDRSPPFENCTARSVAASGTNMDKRTQNVIVGSLALGAAVASLYF